jgi:hypothetical protein
MAWCYSASHDDTIGMVVVHQQSHVVWSCRRLRPRFLFFRWRYGDSEGVGSHSWVMGRLRGSLWTLTLGRPVEAPGGLVSLVMSSCQVEFGWCGAILVITALRCCLVYAELSGGWRLH